MKKKVVKKKISAKPKKIQHHKIPVKKSISPKESQTEKILIENFVSLQRVMTNLSLKFDNLTKQISKLLELFEISAKVLAEKDVGLEKGDPNKKIIEKMDTLLDQNKIIAKGLTLMHEKFPEETSNYPPAQQPPQQMQKKPEGIEGYQKSISSGMPTNSPIKRLPKR